VGANANGYLQQLPPSQQAGFPQQATTVAAWAASDRKSAAANVNTSALNFIRSSPWEMLRRHMRATLIPARAISVKERDLDPEIVLEIEDSRPVIDPTSEFAGPCTKHSLRRVAVRIPGVCERLRSPLLALLIRILFGRNRISDVARGTRLIRIVCGLRTAGRVCRLTQGKLRSSMLCP
jgi:hypothetical protein